MDRFGFFFWRFRAKTARTLDYRDEESAPGYFGFFKDDSAIILIEPLADASTKGNRAEIALGCLMMKNFSIPYRRKIFLFAEKFFSRL